MRPKIFIFAIMSAGLVIGCAKVVRPAQPVAASSAKHSIHGPYSLEVLSKHVITPIEAPKEEVVKTEVTIKRHPGCWQFSDLDIVVPLERTTKRLLVKCFNQENWILDRTGLEGLPKGLKIETESEIVSGGLYTRYYLTGETVDDGRYAEIKFRPNEDAGVNAKAESIVFRVQSGNPKTFSDECANADLVPYYEAEVKAPIDYSLSLCNTDDGRDLNITVEPTLPEGVTLVTKRTRPNRVLISLGGKAIATSHEIYKFKILRGPIQLNPISLEFLIRDPFKKPSAQPEPIVETVKSDVPAPPSVVLNLSGSGDVYLDQKKVNTPYQVDLDGEEHSVQVINGGKLEYSRRIPKAQNYKGPSMDIWNIVTNGSFSAYGQQTDRESIAEKILEMRRRSAVSGRSVASTQSPSILSTIANKPGAVPEGRLSLREMDMTVELKMMRKLMNKVLQAAPSAGDSN